ncbi:hypothetical protein C8R43DRAFT_1146756, partial [Mycena crocata]
CQCLDFCLKFLPSTDHAQNHESSSSSSSSPIFKFSPMLCLIKNHPLRPPRHFLSRPPCTLSSVTTMSSFSGVSRPQITQLLPICLGSIRYKSLGGILARESLAKLSDSVFLGPHIREPLVSRRRTLIHCTTVDKFLLVISQTLYIYLAFLLPVRSSSNNRTVTILEPFAASMATEEEKTDITNLSNGLFPARTGFHVVVIYLSLPYVQKKIEAVHSQILTDGNSVYRMRDESYLRLRANVGGKLSHPTLVMRTVED